MDKVRDILKMLFEGLDHSTLLEAISMAEAEIFRQRGYKDGRGAGSWVIDARMSDEDKARFRQGMDDGDPAVLDMLPSNPLSGEWADQPTWEEILTDELPYTPNDADQNDLQEEYTQAFDLGVAEEVEQSLKGHSVKTPLFP